MFVRVEVLLAARGPAESDVEGVAGAGAIGGILGALVEGHGNVGAEGDLHVHGMLGREEMAGAVKVRTELHTVFRDFSQVVQAEYLEASGVGEDGAGPAHETVQAAEAADELVAGAEIEMIGVAEDDLRVKLFKEVLRDGLDRCGCSDGHEDGSFDRSVREGQGGSTGRGFGLVDFEVERH